MEADERPGSDRDKLLPLHLVFRKLRNPRDLAAASLVSRVLLLLDLPGEQQLIAGTKEWRRSASSPDLWTTLDLSGKQQATDLLFKVPKVIQYRHHLRSLQLQFTAGVEDCHLEALRGLQLEALNLNGCQAVSDEGLARLLKALPDLRRLELYWILAVTDRVLLSLATYCPRLSYLSLSGCNNITDEGLRVLTGACNQLEHLDLTRCLKLSGKVLESAAGKCPELRELRLYACSQLTDQCLRAFGRLEHLRLIDVCGGHRLTDEGLLGLARCHKLRSVNLTWCIQVTDRGVCCLVESNLALQSLSLHGIQGVTQKVIATLSKTCKRTLHTLDVNGCTGIKSKNREALKELLPKLQCFVIHT